MIIELRPQLVRNIRREERLVVIVIRFIILYTMEALEIQVSEEIIIQLVIPT